MRLLLNVSYDVHVYTVVYVDDGTADSLTVLVIVVSEVAVDISNPPLSLGQQGPRSADLFVLGQANHEAFRLCEPTEAVDCRRLLTWLRSYQWLM